MEDHIGPDLAGKSVLHIHDCLTACNGLRQILDCQPHGA
jgi:hypothetical protein